MFPSLTRFRPLKTRSNNDSSILPRWLNWFTANIGYHHIHHLSSRIPNYRLIGCHNEYRHLFDDVRRVKLMQVPRALRYILWDARAQRIISVAEYRQQLLPASRDLTTPRPALIR